MTSKLFLSAVLAAFSTPALAGVVVPGPEAGAGLAAMAMVGAGYIFLRRRRLR